MLNAEIWIWGETDFIGKYLRLGSFRMFSKMGIFHKSDIVGAGGEASLGKHSKGKGPEGQEKWEVK